MAGSIGNTLRYGNKKTKRLLYFLIILGVLAILFGILSLIFSNVVLGVLAAAVLFADVFILAKTNFSKLSMQEQEKQARTEKKQTGKKQAEAVPKKKKEKPQKEDDEGPGALEWVFSEKKKEEQEEEKEKKKEREKPPANSLQQYDEKQLKKVFIAYKVRREHVPIMIDYCQAEHISQCPAYLWKDREFLYFLLLEDEARMVKCPISDADAIHVRRGVPAKPSAEYPEMQEKSLVSKVFAPYLPNYYHSGGSGTYIEYRKNCYSLAPGIWCTAASVQNMLKILPREFCLEEEKLNSDDYNIYFRKIYIDRILYRDAVFTAADYDQKVRETLASLAHADIADDTFHYYLAQMVMKNLIPQEYADFAMAKRMKKKKI